MPNLTSAVRLQLARQIAQWQAGVATMNDPRNFAPLGHWSSTERGLGVPLRESLQQSVDRLRRDVVLLAAGLAEAQTLDDLARVRGQILEFRWRAVQVATLLDLYGDAVVERAASGNGTLLRGCDTLAERCAAPALGAIGQAVPPFLTYLDRGQGDQINAAGLRIYDGGPVNPAAVLSVARDSLWVPTAICHEVGHQVAALSGWIEELASTIHDALHGERSGLRATWAAWAGEVGPDAFSFASTGYASVAGLHDVLLIRRPDEVFFVGSNDPHPSMYIRVLLGVEMCRRFFGAGPWDDLAAAWRHANPLTGLPAERRELFERSAQVLGRIVEASLERPMRAFGGRPLAALVDPARVSPRALERFARSWGGAAFTSPIALWREPLRVLGLSGLRMATAPAVAAGVAAQNLALLKRLGELRQRADAVARPGRGVRIDGMAGSLSRR